MINPNELRIDCFFEGTSRKGRMVIYPYRCNFVKIAHIPSGITVTKESKSQVKAKQEALEELEMLVELWEWRE
jgi:protein subunit release factor A